MVLDFFKSLKKYSIELQIRLGKIKLTFLGVSISLNLEALERPTPAMLMEEQRKLIRTMRSRNTPSKKYNQV